MPPSRPVTEPNVLIHIFDPPTCSYCSLFLQLCSPLLRVDALFESQWEILHGHSSKGDMTIEIITSEKKKQKLDIERQLVKSLIVLSFVFSLQH